MSLPEGHSSEDSEAEGRGCSQRKRYPRVGLTHCWWLGKNMGARIIVLIVREATKYKSALIWPSRPVLYLGNMSGVHSLLPHCSGFRTHFLLPVSPPSCWLVFLPKTEFDHVTISPAHRCPVSSLTGQYTSKLSGFPEPGLPFSLVLTYSLLPLFKHTMFTAPYKPSLLYIPTKLWVLSTLDYYFLCPQLISFTRTRTGSSCTHIPMVWAEWKMKRICVCVKKDGYLFNCELWVFTVDRGSKKN